MQQLSEHNLVAEEWGGDTITVKMSAKKGEGINELLEMILLVAEMADLHAEASASRVVGSVIEAKVDRGKGPVATVLIQRGTLKIGTPWLQARRSARSRRCSTTRASGSPRPVRRLRWRYSDLSTTPAGGRSA